MSRNTARLRILAIFLAQGLPACEANTTMVGAPTLLVIPQTVTLPPSTSSTFRTANASAAYHVTWQVRESDGGTIDSTGLYRAPSNEGNFHVVAVETPSGVAGQATVTVTAACWQLLPVSSARFFPRAGQAAAMVGGTIQGSNTSATNGFVTLATITAEPTDGAWTELSFANTTPYRWVKYYGPPGSYGQIAELELYSGTTKLTGAGFGTAGSRSGNPWQNALDGSTATFFDGATANDQYVGLDLASGHVVATPVISPAGGTFSSAQVVTLSSTTAGATIRYTTAGSDPAGGALYAAPFTVASTATIRAVATASCMQQSDGATAQFTIGGGGGGGGGTSQTSVHLGNSLTDTINGYLAVVAAAGGKNLSYNRYTIPGIGTWLYSGDPTGGLDCCGNIQSWMQTHTPIDNLVMQPFPNMPCSPDGYPAACAAGDENCAMNRSDAVNIEQAWADAHVHNPNVQVWVYMAWPPTPSEGFSTCMTGGGWSRWSKASGAASDPPSGWNTVPSTWETAVAHQAMWNEAVRAQLVSMHPSWPAPYIVPAGQVLQAIKASVEAGMFPGVASSAFWSTFFSNGGTDNHVTSIGAYAVSLTFYAVFFKADPRSLPDSDLGTGLGVTAAQAAAIQQIVWQTVSGYALSGYSR